MAERSRAAAEAALVRRRARRPVSTQPPPVSRRSFRFLSLVFRTLIFFSRPFSRNPSVLFRKRARHTHYIFARSGHAPIRIRVVFLPHPSSLSILPYTPVFSSRQASTPKAAIVIVDVDTRPSPVTKCTEDGQTVCINAGLRGLAPYFSFIDFPFCSGRWCESSSVITVHIGGGENDKTKRRAGGSRKG